MSLSCYTPNVDDLLALSNRFKGHIVCSFRMRSPEFAIRSSSHPFGFKYAFVVKKPSLVLRKRRFRDQRGRQLPLTSIAAAAPTGESTIDIVVNKAIEAVQVS